MIFKRDFKMRFLILLLTLLVSSASIARDLDRAPADFTVAASTYTFVDFTKAEYQLVYDLGAKSAVVNAKINFLSRTSARPVFDMVADATSVMLDGQVVALETVSLPANASKVRAIAQTVAAGTHVLSISVPLKQLVEWGDGGVKSALWASDLRDRGYLETYMPANLEFDRVPMTFKVEFLGATTEQRIYTNGLVVGMGANKFEITYPDYYTSSSIFFHTAPVGVMKEVSFIFRSTDGRELPVVIYKRPGLFGGEEAALERLKQSTIRVLTELENDYGPFMHPSVTIYNAGSGGMEYCGATMTDVGALGHELIHSYFARGTMPANGNAGWIDEAIASWRDNNYPRATSISGTANMAGRAAYTRFTDMAAYSYGARFMAYLDGKFADQGGLKSLLRKMVEEKPFTPYFTEDFIEWAEGHYRMDLKSEFKRVYGGKSEKESEHPVHRKMSLEELRQHL